MKPPLAVPRALQEQLDFALSAALKITGDLGNIQLYDPWACSLRIVSHRGFSPNFLSFFAETREAEAACGTALLRGTRTVVEDVARDSIFSGTPARQVMLRAGARAVQSTPLLSESGSPLGMISTHYGEPTQPSLADLYMIDRLAQQAACLIEKGFILVPRPAGPKRPADGGKPQGTYELFNRIGELVTFVEHFTSRERAIERLERWSLREAGEFVLFHEVAVVAVARCGIVELRDSFRISQEAAMSAPARKPKPS